jgi:cytochrome o ubiquinol oxidase operon protein cyoD
MATFKTYLTGFILSVTLTLVAYAFVYSHVSSAHVNFSHTFLTYTVLILALIQLLVQLIFFLHLGNGGGSRWNLVAFIFTFGVVMILVVGSLWIMDHLNYNMNPQQMDNQLLKMEGMKGK